MLLIIRLLVLHKYLEEEEIKKTPLLPNKEISLNIFWQLYYIKDALSRHEFFFNFVT